MDFDLAQVRAFVTAAEELHFGRAAARLFLSQQGLSKRIQRLEQTVGEPLFRRHHNQVELTDTGRRFLPYARQLLATAEQTAADLWPQARPLRIDVWGQVHAPLRIVGRLAAQLPQLVPELSMRRSFSAALDALERDELDLAFGRPFDLLRPLPPDLALHPAYLEPISVAMSVDHPLADVAILTADDLQVTGLWWPLDNSQGEVAGFLHCYGEEHAIPVTTRGLNLGMDSYLDALRTDPALVGLVGAEWPIASTDGLSIVGLTPVPQFLWWVASRRDARHPQLRRFLGLLEETGRREGWLHVNPGQGWLPAADRSRFSEYE